MDIKERINRINNPPSEGDNIRKKRLEEQGFSDIHRWTRDDLYFMIGESDSWEEAIFYQSELIRREIEAH